MFHSDGVTSGVLYEGIVWDGAGKAEMAISHASSTKYESHVTHRNEAFYNVQAGIVTGYSKYFTVSNNTAEVLFDNCLFVNCVNGVAFGNYNALDNTLRVHGKDQKRPKDGLLGLMTMFNALNPSDITVEDSQSLVFSDYYTEQTDRVFLLKGNPGDMPGRVTIQEHKFQGFTNDDMIHVCNYKGAFFLGATFIPEPRKKPGHGGTEERKPLVFSHKGANPVDIMLVGCEHRYGEPILQKESGANFILAHDTVKGRRGPWHTELPKEAGPRLAAAFDHLRELGEMDYEFNHSPAAERFVAALSRASKAPAAAKVPADFHTRGPIIATYGPTSGMAWGGEELVVKGYNFHPQAKVTLGGLPCTELKVGPWGDGGADYPAKLLRCKTPGHPAGLMEKRLQRIVAACRKNGRKVKHFVEPEGKMC